MALEHLVHAARSDRAKSGRSRTWRASEGSWRTAEAAGARPAGPDGPRVLVVDPNPTIRRAVLELLKLHDMTVAEAADAGGALACLRNWHPTVAVVEMRLRNGRTGLEVLRSLQAMDRRLAVIISSAATDPLPGAELRAAGAYAVYARNGSFQGLVDAIHAAHDAYEAGDRSG